jgi:hypothetical protein
VVWREGTKNELSRSFNIKSADDRNEVLLHVLTFETDALLPKLLSEVP